jgi:hypothetical protein
MKSYSLITLGQEHTLPIAMNGTNKFIKFIKESPTDNTGYFATDDKKLQKAIEESQFFESGGEEEIKLFFSTEEDEEVEKPAKKSSNPPVSGKPAKAEFEPEEFPDVTDFKSAKDILTGEPYKVVKTNKSLLSPEGILAKAGELGISFPNLKVAE